MSLLLAFVSAASGWEYENRACDAAAAKAERQWNVPTGVLSAVGTVESGRGKGELGAAPWPWTINAAGRGSWFSSKDEAVAAVLALMAQGYPYIDVGCFQIDLAYHAGVFRSLDEAFDPERNAQAAAQILADERARAPDWAVAVARYHSRTPTLGGPYLDRVRTALPMAKLRSAYAWFASFSEPPVTGPEPLLGLAAPQSLPRVVYLSPARRLGREPQIIYLGQSGVSPVTETREHVGADHP